MTFLRLPPAELLTVVPLYLGPLPLCHRVRAGDGEGPRISCGHATCDAGPVLTGESRAEIAPTTSLAITIALA